MTMTERILPLDSDNMYVRRAKKAEQRLNRHYGLNPKEHEIFAEKYGINVRVCEYGSEFENTVLIVPGNTGDCFPFIPLIAQLPGRRILALNRPGGGLSEGFNHKTADFKALALDTISTVLDYFKIASIPIIAHSMGAHWSLWFAMANPERVQCLALLGVPGNVLDCHPPLALRLTSIPGLNRRLFDAITPKSADTALRGLSFLGHSSGTLSQLPREMAECYYHFQQLPNYKISSLSLMEKTNTIFGSKSDARITQSDLNKASQPVMLIWGGNDPFGNVAKGKTIASALSKSVFLVIANGGHLPWLDDLSRCGQEISKFLGMNQVN